MAPVGVYTEEQTLVECQTTKGKLALEINHKWAPIGAAHFLDMVKDGFYTDIALFRSVPDFIVQFGVNDRTAPELRLKYMHSRPLDDDPPVGNKVLRGTLTYAGGGPATRTSQLAKTHFACDDDSKWQGLPLMGAAESGRDSHHNSFVLLEAVESYGTDDKLTVFDLAPLEDMGLYLANYSECDFPDYGAHQGCDFVSTAEQRAYQPQGATSSALHIIRHLGQRVRPCRQLPHTAFKPEGATSSAPQFTRHVAQRVRPCQQLPHFHTARMPERATACRLEGTVKQH